MKLYERIENNNFDEIDKNRAIELIECGNGHLIYNENYFKLQKENEKLKNIELKSKGGAIKISLEGILFLENKIKQLEKEKKKLELEIKNRKFSHMNLYNEYKYYKQFKSLSIETIKNKIEYLDKQQADWIEDRELKVSDSEIIFARDTLEKLLEDNYEKF